MGDFPEPYKRNMLLLFSCDQEHLFEVRRLFPEFEDFGSAAVSSLSSRTLDQPPDFSIL